MQPVPGVGWQRCSPVPFLFPVLRFRRLTDSSVLRCADLLPALHPYEGRRLAFWFDGRFTVVSTNPDNAELLRAYRDAWVVGLLRHAVGEMRAELTANYLKQPGGHA